jgi:hypothetical protein
MDMFASLLAIDDDTTMEGEVETDVELEPTLPNEIITSILEILIAEEAMHTLATFAIANKAMYAVIYPKLYRTIRITDTNQDKLLVGCTGTSAFTIAKLMSRCTRRIAS